jgi:hypothetical protein
MGGGKVTPRGDMITLGLELLPHPTCITERGEETFAYSRGSDRSISLANTAEP